MDFNSINEIKKENFIGFKKICELFDNACDISCERGVYLVLYLNKDKPVFVEKGVGGYFRGNPNVSIECLNSRWIYKTITIYIGQAGGIRNGKWSNNTLCRRISDYLRFGKGESVGHKGGRLIWQIKDYQDLVFCWQPLPNKIVDPKKYENELKQKFKSYYNGSLPFANLV